MRKIPFPSTHAVKDLNTKKILDSIISLLKAMQSDIDNINRNKANK